MKKTLAIETSCDDTSLAVVAYESGLFSVEKLQAYSQIKEHQAYGGIVPEIAFRLHSEQILALLQHFSGEEISSVDFFTVTTHPGLAGSLLVGKTVAEMLGHQYKKPVKGVNHIYGHLFSLLLERNIQELPFPWVVLTASGGHNEIYVVAPKDIEAFLRKTAVGELFAVDDFTITKLGKTLDDAAGECFDKVARMVGGPYPGGARIGQQALSGKANEEFRFKRIYLREHENPYDFSFSGMKAQVYNLLQKLGKEGRVVIDEGDSELKAPLPEDMLHDIAYEFQEAIVDVLVDKLLHAVQEFGAKTVGIVGGVSANDKLFEQADERIFAKTGVHVLRPAKKVYSTDNGAMIGVIGILS